MSQLLAALDAAWKVLLVGLLLGAGLPTLYSVGVRQLALAGDTADPARASARRATAWVIFAVVMVAVLLGIGYIVAHGLGMTITFDGLIPHFGKK